MEWESKMGKKERHMCTWGRGGGGERELKREGVAVRRTRGRGVGEWEYEGRYLGGGLRGGGEEVNG